MYYRILLRIFHARLRIIFVVLYAHLCTGDHKGVTDAWHGKDVYFTTSQKHTALLLFRDRGG